MDFAVDSTLLEEAKTRCTTDADTIQEQIDGIFEKIDNLGDYWKGESYESFKGSCEGYKESLNQLVNLLKAYSKLLENVSEPEETLETGIKEALG